MDTANIHSHVYDKIITVAVGPDDAKKKFKVYRGLLCHFSSYFDRMLNGSFREGGSTYLCLRDIEVETFEVFYYWLNSGVLDWTDSGGPLDWEKVIRVYFFANFHQAHKFRNAVLESLFLDFEARLILDATVIPALYTNTTDGDAMRKLLVDLMAGYNSENYPRSALHFMDKEFLFDYIIKCTRRKVVPGSGSEAGGIGTVRKNFCERYHHHDERVSTETNGKS